MPAFILAIFLSAFLLFQVQPIIARYILPWYGGSPAVWTTCMLFFQVGLLAGYTYAHCLVSRFRERPRRQAGIHLLIVVTSLLLLPITPPESLKPTGVEPSPVAGILLLLFVTVGLPYMVIAASGPLLQYWFSKVEIGKSPYRLYAISNLGSLLGLLTYPVIFEPNLRLGQQTSLWSAGYGVYALLAGFCAWKLLRREQPMSTDAQSEPTSTPAAPAPWIDRLAWVAFAACGSLMLLATTNQMCQDVAVVPFLWVLPLSLYLITFIIAFDHARWYYRPFWISFAALSIAAVIYLINQDYAKFEIHLAIQIGIYACTVFSTCMVCHGEMVRLKPDARYLTGFYLAVSLGGALGGVFVSLVAPEIFNGYWEFHLGLLAVVALAGAVLFRDFKQTSNGRHTIWRGAGGLLWISGLLAMGFFLMNHRSEVMSQSIRSTRGFYGVLHVYEDYVGTIDHFRVLYHGRINHGSQYLSDDYRHLPRGYYTALSGPGVVFTNHPHRSDSDKPRPINFGIIGLGVGTLVSYATPGDTVRLYEINPQIEDIARADFTFLADCEGDETVVLGDARITLEQELASGHSQQFDILFVDAFSGDSIPIHLLTREAFEVYLQHLKADGVLAVHITNLHLDLSNPVRTLAREFGLDNIQIEHDPVSEWANYSRWIMITKNQKLLNAIEAAGQSTPWESPIFREILWTDDYCNLLEVIDWD